MPRSYFISLPEAGTYVIFHEYQSSVAGRVFATNNVNLSGMHVSLVGKATGEQVKVVPRSATYAYSSGVSGVSILEFDIRKPGVYQCSAWYEKGAGPEIVLAIGKGSGDKMWGVIVRSLAILFIALGLSIVTGLVIFLKRKTARRSAQSLPAAGEAAAIEPA